MTSLKKIVMTICLLSSVVVLQAQIKNQKTETVMIYGNCGICEKTIEKVGSLNKIAVVDWNKDTKMAMLTYDPNKTSKDEILKNIALAGYDSDVFLAPTETYNNLPGCCQYDRKAKVEVVATTETMAMPTAVTSTKSQKANELKSVFDNYISLKNALVKTDGKSSMKMSQDLLTSINKVKKESLSMDVHMVWMKVYKNLSAEAKNIAETSDIKKQRETFKSLSKNMFEVMKISKLDETLYYQYCPMQDAYWISTENKIQNPYYGSQMMTCGKVVETIK